MLRSINEVYLAMLKRLLLLFIVLTVLTGLPVQATETRLRFCYEDKPLLPFYSGHGLVPADPPGAAIEHLRAAAEASNLQLELIRQPWLRCLQQLEDNSIDALVAEYSADREHYMQMPRTASGEADPRFAMSSFSLCLAYHPQSALPDKLANGGEFTIARPLGYRPIPLPAKSVQVHADSINHALDLVSSGRVDATTVLCQFNDQPVQPAELQQRPVLFHPQPVHRSVGYLMLSNAFFKAQPDVAQNLWRQVANTRSTERYLEYLQQQNP